MQKRFDTDYICMRSLSPLSPSRICASIPIACIHIQLYSALSQIVNQLHKICKPKGSLLIFYIATYYMK